MSWATQISLNSWVVVFQIPYFGKFTVAHFKNNQ